MPRININDGSASGVNRQREDEALFTGGGIALFKPAWYSRGGEAWWHEMLCIAESGKREVTGHRLQA